MNTLYSGNLLVNIYIYIYNGAICIKCVCITAVFSPILRITADISGPRFDSVESFFFPPLFFLAWVQSLAEPNFFFHHSFFFLPLLCTSFFSLLFLFSSNFFLPFSCLPFFFFSPILFPSFLPLFFCFLFSSLFFFPILLLFLLSFLPLLYSPDSSSFSPPLYFLCFKKSLFLFHLFAKRAAIKENKD